MIDLECPCTALEMNQWIRDNPLDEQQISEHPQATYYASELLKMYASTRNSEGNSFDHGLLEFLTLTALIDSIETAREAERSGAAYLIALLAMPDTLQPYLEINFEEGIVRGKEGLKEMTAGMGLKFPKDDSCLPNEQQLVDTLIQCVLTVLDRKHHESFMEMTQEERVAWIEKQLNSSGFRTSPGAGCKWLRLERKDP